MADNQFVTVSSDSLKHTIMLDRKEIATALAKAIAYKMCGKHNEANDWARKLILLLQCADILKS
jgi:hypothetical protein